MWYKETKENNCEMATRNWELLDISVDIRELAQSVVEETLNKSYEDQDAYEQYIITICVRNLEAILPTIKAYIDQMQSKGTPIGPEDIMHELFLLVCNVNPLLLMDTSDKGGQRLQRQCYPHKQKEVEEQKCPAACEPVQEKRLQHVDHAYMLSLDHKMNESIIGQEEAVSTLSDSIITAFAGIKEPRIPIGNYIFIGNTGVGKTYTAVTLNDVMIGNRNALHRFDMSEFAEGHEYTKLIGAPSGYRGFEKGGILTNAVAAWPFCVILADEIEEAHQKTRKIFLQIMDEGHLKDGQGNEVQFGESTLIMTSNIGVEDVESYQSRIGIKDPNMPTITPRAKEDTLRKAVEEFFPAKFLNRVDDVIFFRDLEWDEYWQVAKLELAKTVALVAENKSISIQPTDDIITWIRDNGCNMAYGARPMKRFIKTYFRLPLAKILLNPETDIQAGDRVLADIHNNKLHFEKE